MSTNSIVPVQPNNAVLAQGGLGIDEGSLKPEAMILVQPTTKDLPKGIATGSFYDKTSGLTFEKLIFVPIIMGTRRAKYSSKGYKSGEKATCKSVNGLVPITNSKFLVPEAPNCGYMQGDRFIPVCDFAKWDNTKTGKEAAPHCRENYRIDFIEFETKLPFFITLTGLSVKVGKKLKDAINRQATIINARAKAEEYKASVFDFVVEMTAVSAGDSAAYMVSFPRVQRMTPEKASEFGPLYLQILEARNSYAAQQQAEDDEEAVNTAAGQILDADYVDGDAPVPV